MFLINSMYTITIKNSYVTLCAILVDMYHPNNRHLFHSNKSNIITV